MLVVVKPVVLQQSKKQANNKYKSGNIRWNKLWYSNIYDYRQKFYSSYHFLLFVSLVFCFEKPILLKIYSVNMWSEGKNKTDSNISIPSREERTFHSERGGACHLSVVVLGLAAVDAGVLGEDLEQQQRVLVSVVEELALVAGGQNLGVFVPGHLGLRQTADLHWEANRSTWQCCLGLHGADDLRRLRHCEQRAGEMKLSRIFTDTRVNACENVAT